MIFTKLITLGLVYAFLVPSMATNPPNPSLRSGIDDKEASSLTNLLSKLGENLADDLEAMLLDQHERLLALERCQEERLLQEVPTPAPTRKPKPSNDPNKALQTKIKKLQKLAQKALKRSKANNAKIATLTTTFAAVQAQVADAASKLEGVETTVLVSFETKNEAVEAALEELSGQIAEVTTTVSEQTGTFDDVVESLSNHQERISLVELAQDAAVVAVEGLQADVELLTGSVAANGDKLVELEESIQDNTDDIGTLSGTLDGIQTSLDGLTSTVTGHTDKLQCVSSSTNASSFIFEGCNVHVRNTGGATSATDGLGNIIIGYNEECTGCGRAGSHNLIMGVQNNYKSYGGLVGGMLNSIEQPFGAILTGSENKATGTYGAVISGSKNTAKGEASVVLGGKTNSALGSSSSIVGGETGTTSANFAVVLGGSNQLANDMHEISPNI